jgi:hypothetical protein
VDVVVVVSVVLSAAAVGSPLLLAALYRRQFGSFFAGLKAHSRTVRVPVSHEDADGLCHRALRATIGDSESDRTGPNSFECAGLEFRLAESAAGTAITIRGGAVGNSWMHMPAPGEVRAGYARVDAVADWIAAAPLTGPLAEQHESYRHFGVQ